jgi:hypothetical protein
MTSLRLNGASFVREDQTTMTTDFMIVPVADIELIGIAVRELAASQEAAKVSG